MDGAGPKAEGVALRQVLSLLDLFVPASARTQSERARTSTPIPAALARAASATAQSLGFLPSTPFAAAWLAVQQQWRGSDSLRLQEPLADAERGILHCAHHLVAGEDRVAKFLHKVDAVRRALHTTPPDPDDEADPDSASVWLSGAHAASAASFAAPRRITLGIDGSQLFIDRPAVLFDNAVAQTVLDAIVHTTGQLLERPGALLADIETIAPAQAQRVLRDLNEPLSPAQPGLNLPAVFRRQVQLRGAATALAWQGGAMSYRELDERSDRMAQRLCRAGVAPGEVVCIALDRSADAIVVLLGILKAGAAYLPVDTSYPVERLAFMLNDAAVRLVVTTSACGRLFPATLASLFVDQPARDDDAPEDAGSAADVITGESLAYVMYTSGSTGTPKGIEICHRSILRLVVDARFMALSAQEVMLHAAPLGFDASTLEIWGPLLNGGRCVLHHETIPSGPGLAQTIREQGVTSAWLTAALFNAIVDDDPIHFRGLQQLLAGGEALSVAHIRRTLDALPGLTLINGYGPTECTTFTATYRIPRDFPAEAGRVPIGRPVNDTPVYILGPTLKPVPAGIVGELFVGGPGLARGYLRRPQLNAERFLADPFGAPGQRLYRTGDLVRYLEGGDIDFIGRSDGQVKVRGFRIEIGEIEVALARHPGVKACAVVARDDGPGGARLVAYVVPRGSPVAAHDLRKELAIALPEFMLPAAYVSLESLPVTLNGKLDRRALPVPPLQRPELGQPYQAPLDDEERRVSDVFASILGVDRVGRLDNFFELGGNSLLVLKALARLQQGSMRRLSTTLFFEQPTAEALSRALRSDVAPGVHAAAVGKLPALRPGGPLPSEPIAIIAMAGRFPGAADVEQLWDNLCAGRDTITVFKDGELDPALPASLIADPAYVKARGVVDDVEMFDAAFFGIPPKEAELMDPQQRIFLELCWQCLERGGYAPDQVDGPVGVFAGMYNATYFQRHVAHRPDLIEKVGEFQVMLANEKDYIATRTANRLNLTGPAVSVHTACSTSLVAIAQAVSSLRDGQCTMALAGGSSITCPPRSGYLYQDGAMLSPDGHTRTFAADARGTVFSDGAAVVLLKRLADALADGDTIHAVIRGVAINNDGRDKASFTAPSVAGQAAVICAALSAAGVEARSISYVETHGTATPLGDPVEIEALTQAYRRETSDTGFCAVGSIKSNIGHVVIAAGAAGVIKTAFALAHERIPASLHFDAPNPKIDFSSTPFYVNAVQREWPRSATPRRAGVSSFGVGGTNAHVVMEEAPVVAASAPSSGPQLLMLSARSPAALQAAVARLADHLEAEAQLNLADVAHTLRVGRSSFIHRACVVAASPGEAVERLRSGDTPWKAAHVTGDRPPEVVFMFPGQGAQYQGMGRSLYATQPVFRDAVDACLQALPGDAGALLQQVMFEGSAEALAETAVTQPATFVLEYALARTWLAIGVEPVALIGHSVGEFAAAALAGVMTAADAMRLVTARGQLMQAQPAGSMLSIRLPVAQVLARLPQGVSMAAENAPGSCVVSGPSLAIHALRTELEAQGAAVRLLQTSHAFHSEMMDAAVAPFEAEVRKVELRPPTRTIFSTLTGQRLSDAEATDPHYWARHLRGTVRFSPALGSLLASLEAPLTLEIGPRATLVSFARQHAGRGKPAIAAIASLGDRPEDEPSALRLAAGRLWALGAEVAPAALDPVARRLRVRLPTYPFERKRFWVDAPVPVAIAPVAVPATPELPVSPALTVLSPEPVMTAVSAAPLADRKPRIVERLRVLFEDVSGIEMSDAAGDAPFVELGLDSLALTQVAMQLKKTFSVSLTFRQLMETLRSLDSVAAYLDASMPADPVAAPASAAVAPAAPAGGVAMVALPARPALPVGPGASFVQQVIEQQMQLMAQQLALLGGAGVPAPVATGAPSVPVAAQPVADPAPAAAAAIGTDAEPDTPPKMMTYDVQKAFGAIARIHTSKSEAISERQRARLGAFMRGYVERTAKSKAYTTKHRPHLADPRVVNGFRPLLKEIVYQIVVDRSKGSRMWDLDGNEYVDALNGFGMSLFGWQPGFVLDAVRDQLDSGYDIGPQHPLAGEVAELVCEMTGFDRAGLCNTGSEAVMGCVRIARTVTGRSKIAIFAGAYHGIFDEVLVRGTKKMRSVPAAPGILPNTAENVVVLEYAAPETLQYLRDHAEEFAAVLVEPVQSRRPDLQPREFLRELRVVTEDIGALLIFDEVVTGFRCHPGGIQALFGVRADLASYGKVLGGGFPIGVIAGKREYMDALDGGGWQYGDDSVPTVGVTYFAGTFVRHPLALTAAKAVLEHLKREGPELQTTLTRSTAAMVDELNAFCREAGAPIVLKSFSSVWKVFFSEEHPLQDLLFAMMRVRGVHILDNFPCFFTTAHTAQDIAVIKTAFKEAVAELQEADFLPRRVRAAAAGFDAAMPPAPGARLGRDADGKPAWFIANPAMPGKFMKVELQ